MPPPPTAEADPPAIAAVILAAGKSSRMGCPKPVLPWGNTTILGHLFHLWKQLPSRQIAVVCAHSNFAVAAELDRLSFPLDQRIYNPDPVRGMFSSVQCAARWTGWDSDLTHWAIVLGDQPHLLPTTLRALALFARQNPEKICQPSHRGYPRHPVLLPANAFKELAHFKGENLKQFLQSQSSNIALLELNDPGLDLDLDHPADYEKALQLTLPNNQPLTTDH